VSEKIKQMARKQLKGSLFDDAITVAKVAANRNSFPKRIADG
jgi:hypothetical protein